MKTNSHVSLVKEYGHIVNVGEFGKIIRVLEDRAEVKFDCGLQVVVPLVNLEECLEAKVLPTTEKELVQGQTKPDASASVEMLVMQALDSNAIETERRILESKIARIKAQLASLGAQVKDLDKIAPRAFSAARRVSRMKLSDAARVAEIRAAVGEYAKKG